MSYYFPQTQWFKWNADLKNANPECMLFSLVEVDVSEQILNMHKSDLDFLQQKNCCYFLHTALTSAVLFL